MSGYNQTVSVNPISGYLAAVLLLALLPVGCGLSGYGPAEDHSSFVSADAATDGRYGIFSHHRYVYRPATGIRAFPDGGIPYYVKDTNTLGVYDFATGRVRIIRSEKNRDFQPGQGTFTVAQTSITKAVISQGGQGRSDYLTHLRQYILDIPSGEMTPIDLKGELEKLGRAPGYMYLVDDEGTLVLVTAPLGEDASWVGKESNPKEVFIRHPDGSYEKAATVVHYYPTTDGLVHYFDYERHVYLVYDPATHAGRTPPGRYPPAWNTDKVYSLAVSPDSRNALSIIEKVGDDWHYRDTGITGEGLY